MAPKHNTHEHLYLWAGAAHSLAGSTSLFTSQLNGFASAASATSITLHNTIYPTTTQLGGLNNHKPRGPQAADSRGATTGRERNCQHWAGKPPACLKRTAGAGGFEHPHKQQCLSQ